MKAQPAITPEIIEEHGFTKEEYLKIEEIMGREPSFTELGVFSVMWSEHCSYKSSRIHLKRLPTDGPQVIVPPGENAGVVDIGDDWCVAFKVESHNHPSFIEPFQGAATGVGGILRDVFTMGARPIAAMNSLRFGPLNKDAAGSASTTDKIANRNKSILKGVVEGIAHYGNCFGVPTIGGEVVFDEAYNLNPLVNAFALGIVRKDQIFFGKASGVGNPVMYVGAKTGRDGIHGATMASAEFDDEALEKRPTVQVGDPFLEKLLLEACLEAMRSGAIEGIQDMGAAGLTSSSVEMADRAGTGLELYLDDVPQRETNMTAYEMLLSESQERMLIVAKAGRENELVEIFNKWDLDAVVIGKVVEGNRLKIFHLGELMADLPVDKLTESAPLYSRPMEKPDRTPGSVPAREPVTKDYTEALKLLLASPNICSKHFVYEQYDHMVRTNTSVLPGADAAVVRVKETRRAISMCLDGNGRFSAVNPKEGAKLTVAEAARNNVCAGGRPLAVTNCLNFASPERPKIMWAFSETIDGMKEACETFSTPVISGNVSFYNETDGDGVLPTPTIGMVGLIEDSKKIITQGFKNEGDIIAMLGSTNDDLSVSEYAQTILGYTTNELIEIGNVPVIDLALEKRVQDACLKLNEESLLNSAHDCADGGLAVTIAESCFSSLNNKESGAAIELEHGSLDATRQLFSESPSRIVISFAPEDLDVVRKISEEFECPFSVIGHVAQKDLTFTINGNEVISISGTDLQKTWESALENSLDG